MSELRELLGGIAVSRANPVEITDEFFQKCSVLKLGEVAIMPTFKLSEAMSAVEIMDPKMDIGVHRYKRTVSVDTLIEEGYFENATDREVLTIVDASLAAFVAFLNGSNAMTTLYTNVLLVEPNKSIPRRDLDCLSKAFSHIIPMTRTIIYSAMVYNETVVEFETLRSGQRKVEKRSRSIKRKEKPIDTEDFNESLSYLVPAVMSREDVISYLKVVEQEIVEKYKANQTKSEEHNVMLTLATRFMWMRLYIEIMQALIPPMSDEYDDLVDAPHFKPDFALAKELCTKLKLTSTYFLKSVHFGLFQKLADSTTGTVTDDGNFSWLPVFDPDYNKQHLTGSFPRKTLLNNRMEAMTYLDNFSRSLYRAVSEINLDTFESLIEYVKNNSDKTSCVLSRSVLQLALIPMEIDEKLIGLIPLHHLIEASLYENGRTQYLEAGSTASKDNVCQEQYEKFLSAITKGVLTLIANFGRNVARQRECLGHVLNELYKSKQYAELLDSRALQIMTNSPADNSHHCELLQAWLYHFITQLILYHMELSLNLSLMSPHEYHSTYWYLSEVIFRRLVSRYERMEKVYTKDCEFHSKLAKKRNSQKFKKEEELLKLKLESARNLVMLHYGKLHLCRSMIFSTLALIKTGRIKVHSYDENTEKLRYEHRMMTYKDVGGLFYLTHEQYLAASRYEAELARPTNDLWAECFECFNLTRFYLSKVHSTDDLLREHLQALYFVCTSNSVACNLLASGKAETHVISWNHDIGSLFPVMKLSQH